jgi:cytochrome c6
MSVPDINTVDTGPAPAGAADLAHGRKVYGTNCEPCHGGNGQGAHGEGAALHRGLTAADVTAIATSGRRDMPSFRGVLTSEDLRDVAGYIAGELLPH